MTNADVRILARIEVDLWLIRPEAYREEVRAWLRANGIDPNNVTLRRDVEVVVLDGPAIVRREYVRDPATGRIRIDRTADDAVTAEVHSLLTVPLPEHLADPLEDHR